MNQSDGSGCCSGAPGCCSTIPDSVIQEINLKKKQIIIDFLFLDISVCVR